MTIDFTDVNSVDNRRQQHQFSLDVAEVISVPSDGGHTVTIRRLGDQGGVIGAPVLMSSKGDISLPTPGDLVIIGFAIGGQRIILGTLYDDDAPSYKRGERIIGHPHTESFIKLRRDGVIDLEAPFMQIPRVEEDPDITDIERGALWYNLTEDEYRGKEGETIVSFTTQAVDQ